MFYVYVFRRLKDNKFYKGQTNNLDRRLHEHEIDQWGPFELVYVQVCETRSESVKLETYLKSGIGRQFIHFYYPRTSAKGG